MPEKLTWLEVETGIKSGKTSWIYQLTKKDLLEICERYEVFVEVDSSIDSLRNALSNFVKEWESSEDSEGKEEAATKTNKMASNFGQLPQYKRGENWEAYREQLNAFIMLNSVKAELKTPLLITKLSSEVFEELQIHTQPEEPLETEFKELIKKLDELYIPKKNNHIARFEFRARKQKPGESIDEFVKELRVLMKKCKFSSADLEMQLKDQLISGVGEKLMRYELLKNSDKTLDELVEIARTVELADLQTKNVSAEKSGSNSMEDNKERNEQNINVINKGQRQWKNSNTSVFRGRSSEKSQDTPARSSQRQANIQGIQCYCCGKENHIKSQCTLRNKFCSDCGTQGHIFRMCPQRVNKQIKSVNTSELTDESGNEIESAEDDLEENRFEYDLLKIQYECFEVDDLKINSTVKSEAVDPLWETIEINGIPVKMEIDTGAAVSVISLKDYKNLFKSESLVKAGVKLQTYSKDSLITSGKMNVTIERKGILKSEWLYVVNGGGNPLIGRNWLKALEMWPPKFDDKREHKVHKIKSDPVKMPNEINKLKQEFPLVFAPELGTFTKGKLNLELKEDAKPKFLPPRRLAFSMKSKVEAEIERLVSIEALKPVEYSEWGTPIVPLIKSNGMVRICGDFKTTLNPCLKIDHFPLPRIEHVIEVCRGGEEFTKLDLSEAYQQLPLTEESQKLVVISTHMGLFKYLRLPYGVSTGPGSFQRIMSSLLLGIEGVAVFIDDILVTGRNRVEHLKRLRLVLKRLSEAGLRLRFEKCVFFAPDIEYLGHHINKEGISSISKNIEGLMKAPPPQNITQLRSFLGSINYHAKFVSGLADKLRPLYDILKSDKFSWTSNNDEDFSKIKKCLASHKSLAHFDPMKPIILTCDASPYGISAVLANKFPDGYDHPIGFASRTLSETERKYAHIEKEGLAIVFGVKKFYEYLYGYKFLLQTDNAALAWIFNPKKPVPEIAAARMQRWALFLQAFHFDIKHIRGRENYADWLSRLPLPIQLDDTSKFKILEETKGAYINQIKEYDFATLDWRAVQRETRNDAILCKVLRWVVDGWPITCPQETDIRAFWERRNALTVENNCLLWGHRVVIPEAMRKMVLQELHHSHFGVAKMKALARAFTWWPAIDKDIEEITMKCLLCLENRKNPPKIPLTPWVWPTMPWHRLHADFLGPLCDKNILILLDSHSKWPEAFIMNSMSEPEIIRVLRNLFSRYGFPAHLVTDNFASFKGKEFREFMRNCGIRHSTSPPHHPATNGAAENYVDTFKRKIYAMVKSGMTLSAAVRDFLFDYRCTPHAATKQTPAKLMLNRELRNKLSLLRPMPLETRMLTHQEKQKQNFAGSREISLKVGDSVVTKDYRGGGEAWAPGVIVAEIIPGVTYSVNCEGSVFKRHANQIIPCKLNIGKEVRDRTDSAAGSVVNDGKIGKKIEEFLPRRSERLRNRKV